MKYVDYYDCDICNGISNGMSLFVSGCPFHCKGCFNPETWEFNTGNLYDDHIIKEILEAISANGIIRNFSVLGGEPLAEDNLPMTEDIITKVRDKYPTIDIFLRTGYYFEQLNKGNRYISSILKNINYLIDGPFIEEKRQIGLPLRGSTNQRVWEKDAEDGNLWHKLSV